MSEVSSRFARLAATMTDRISAVDDGAWENPSPCQGWTARDLVQHLVDTYGMFGGFVDQQLTPGSEVAEDPLGAWISARDQMQAWLDDPAVAKREVQGVSGTTTFEASVNRFICFDLLVHGWDLAKATGQDTTIDPAELSNLWADTEAFGDNIRTGGVCGPELPAPEDATEQERLLAFLGRDARA
ncbi:MAG TPA: TIGR03086 family metal-binding protein [Nocardioidaceae bacterium]